MYGNFSLKVFRGREGDSETTIVAIYCANDILAFQAEVTCIIFFVSCIGGTEPAADPCIDGWPGAYIASSALSENAC